MKIIRCATIGLSLNIFCKGVLQDLKKQGYEVVALSSPDDDLKELKEREQVRTIGVEMDRHINPWKDVRSLWQLYRVFRAEKPEMVHSMTPKAGLLCMIAAWMARVPVRIHTFTGLVWPTSTGMKRQILMMTDRLTCACATHVIPEGWGVMSDLIDGKITSKPMRVLGYGNIRGIDLSYWVRTNHKCKMENVKCKIDSDGAPKDVTFTFLFVGRIVGDKGINELISAFARLSAQVKELKSEKVKECRLVLVGWIEDNLDPVTPETKRMIEEMPDIEAVGAKYGDELKAYYEEADCFVFPSYREGFPNTVIEAGAMELASIVTDINGSREIIGPSRSPSKGEDQMTRNMRLKPGEKMSIRDNGVVIPIKDEEALYEAMRWMMEHENERLQMGRKAREMVAERYDQHFVRKQLYEYYNSVNLTN